MSVPAAGFPNLSNLSPPETDVWIGIVSVCTSFELETVSNDIIPRDVDDLP